MTSSGHRADHSACLLLSRLLLLANFDPGLYLSNSALVIYFSNIDLSAFISCFWQYLSVNDTDQKALWLQEITQIFRQNIDYLSRLGSEFETSQSCESRSLVAKFIWVHKPLLWQNLLHTVQACPEVFVFFFTKHQRDFLLWDEERDKERQMKRWNKDLHFTRR